MDQPKLVLVTQGGAFGLQHVSPFCLKAEMLMTQLGLKFDTAVETDPRKPPKGKLPTSLVTDKKSRIQSRSPSILTRLSKVAFTRVLGRGTVHLEPPFRALWMITSIGLWWPAVGQMTSGFRTLWKIFSTSPLNRYEVLSQDKRLSKCSKPITCRGWDDIRCKNKRLSLAATCRRCKTRSTARVSYLPHSPAYLISQLRALWRAYATSDRPHGSLMWQTITRI